MCDGCLKGKKMVGKPKKYEYREEKDRIVWEKSQVTGIERMF